MGARVAPAADPRCAADYAPTLLALVAITASLLAVPFPQSLAGAGLAALAAYIARSDALEFRVPDPANLAAAALGVAVAAQSGELLTATTRAAAAFIAFELFRRLYRYLRGHHELGMGDVKLAAVGAIWLDLRSFSLSLEIACASALAFLLFRRVYAGEGFDLKRRLPFGAFLAPSIWLAWLIANAGGGAL